MRTLIRLAFLLLLACTGLGRHQVELLRDQADADYLAGRITAEERAERHDQIDELAEAPLDRTVGWIMGLVGLAGASYVGMRYRRRYASDPPIAKPQETHDLRGMTAAVVTARGSAPSPRSQASPISREDSETPG